ncbi:A alpha-helical domain with a conserved ER moti [Novosphingobium sp. AAP83]|uniref:alpha-E domain-containing protein n=1 Tax=Novosphingobium sp. AAP83 TaxID=1523425 RepID=UPI0006B97E7E|nr:alpha-E domain-containing protein [Novosphingobium sp. AAP83]KPF93271.1 A alpha-helical domain with a conserved ER moti [Novosphingobium sp. AAP83]
MLGRSANGIFWLFRYLERAENVSRLIEAGFRMALTRSASDAVDEWRSLIVTLGLRQAFEARYGTDYTGPHVFNFILRDKDNPGSILAITEAARTNARMVRGGITREVWESVNDGWMQLREALARPVTETRLGAVLDLVRRQATQVRGAMEGTMLRNEIYNFARIGSFIERADNTARILDVKYYVLLPSVSYVGSSLDNVQWENVLRSVAGERAYRWLNAGRMDPRGIAEFLILDERFPRSLAFCYSKLRSNLASLAREYGSEVKSHEMLGDAACQFHTTTIESIFEQGLHEFIGKFIRANTALALQIQRDYRFTE